MKTIKTTFCLASLALSILAGTTPQLSAAEQPPLNENLKSLARVIGRWDVQWTGENGEPLNARCTAKVGALGAILTVTTEMGADNAPVYGTVQTWYWQPETKTIACVGFDSVGAHDTAVMTKLTDQSHVWQSSGYTPGGKAWSRVSHVEFKNDDSFVYYTTQIVVGGEAKPDGPRMTFKRVKE